MENFENLYNKGKTSGWEEARTMEHSSGIWGRDPMLKYLQEDVIKDGDTVVDLGSGAGYPTLKLSEMVGEKGKVIGVELSKAMLGLEEGQQPLSKKYNLPNINFIRGDVTEVPVDEQSANEVVSFMVLHNLPIDLVQKTFKETARILKAGGTGVFLTMSPKAHESDWDVDFMGYDPDDLKKLKEAKDKEGIKVRGFVKNVGGGTKQIGFFHHTDENMKRAVADAGLEIVSEKEIMVDRETAIEKFGADAVKKIPETPTFLILTVKKPETVTIEA